MSTPDLYDIWNHATQGRVAASFTLEQAAQWANLDETEIEWALEEFGRSDAILRRSLGDACDMDFVIVSAGDAYPGPFEAEQDCDHDIAAKATAFSRAADR